MTTVPRYLELSTSSSFSTDVNADAIFVGHLFGLLCANPRQRQ